MQSHHNKAHVARGTKRQLKILVTPHAGEDKGWVGRLTKDGKFLEYNKVRELDKGVAAWATELTVNFQNRRQQNPHAGWSEAGSVWNKPRSCFLPWPSRSRTRKRWQLSALPRQDPTWSSAWQAHPTKMTETPVLLHTQGWGKNPQRYQQHKSVQSLGRERAGFNEYW